MTTYKDTGKVRIKTKIIGGELYTLCDVVEGKELWIQMPREEPEKCISCGYSGPALDNHHIHGRKNSDETILLCANCHREVHAGVRKV